MCADKSWEVQQGVIGNECCELAPATRGWQVGGGIRRLCLALFAGTLSGRPDVRMVRMSKAEIYKDFDSFMQDGVTPKRKQNDIRLDGKTKGSSRKVFGYFRYNKHGKCTRTLTTYHSTSLTRTVILGKFLLSSCQRQRGRGFGWH